MKTLLVPNDEICKTWREFFKELIGNNCIWDVGIGTVILDTRKVLNMYEGGESITKEEVRRVVLPSIDGKAQE